LNRLLFSLSAAALVFASLADADSVNIVPDSSSLSIASGDPLLFLERLVNAAENPADLSAAGIDWLQFGDRANPADPSLLFDLNDVPSDGGRFNAIPSYMPAARNYNGLAFSGAGFLDSREMLDWENFSNSDREVSPVLEPHMLPVLVVAAFLIFLGQRAVRPNSSK